MYKTINVTQEKLFGRAGINVEVGRPDGDKFIRRQYSEVTEATQKRLNQLFSNHSLVHVEIDDSGINIGLGFNY